jgi:outer membrane protein assembly factor BamB
LKTKFAIPGQMWLDTIPKRSRKGLEQARIQAITMKANQRWLAVMAGGVILAGVGSALGQDWPQWRGPNRDGKASGFNAPAKWPSALTQKWKVTVGTGDATPALVGDRLYVFARQGEEETLRCLKAGNGEELWQNKYVAAAVSGPAARHPGPRSSPTMAEGKVVTLGACGVLSCLDAATGKELWRKDEFPKVVPQFFTAMSPIVTDGLCIAHLGGRDNGAVIAYDLATGNPRWKWAGDGPAYSSPVVMTAAGVKQVIVQTDKNLMSLAVADGKVLWQIPTPPQGRFYNSATPIVDKETVIYTGQGKGTRAVKVEKQGETLGAKELWTNDQLGTGFNTPVLKDGLLYGLSGQGSFFCLNAQTGQSAWTDTATRRENFGAILDAGSVLLALPSNAELIAIKPGDKQYEELARIKLSETPTYAHPVVAGNRVFVKDSEALTLWTID